MGLVCIIVCMYFFSLNAALQKIEPENNTEIKKTNFPLTLRRLILEQAITGKLTDVIGPKLFSQRLNNDVSLKLLQHYCLEETVTDNVKKIDFSFDRYAQMASWLFSSNRNYCISEYLLIRTLHWSQPLTDYIVCALYCLRTASNNIKERFRCDSTVQFCLDFLEKCFLQQEFSNEDAERVLGLINRKTLFERYNPLKMSVFLEDIIAHLHSHDLLFQFYRIIARLQYKITPELNARIYNPLNSEQQAYMRPSSSDGLVIESIELLQKLVSHELCKGDDIYKTLLCSKQLLPEVVVQTTCPTPTSYWNYIMKRTTHSFVHTLIDDLFKESKTRSLKYEKIKTLIKLFCNYNFDLLAAHQIGYKKTLFANSPLQLALQKVEREKFVSANFIKFLAFILKKTVLLHKDDKKLNPHSVNYLLSPLFSPHHLVSQHIYRDKFFLDTFFSSSLGKLFLNWRENDETGDTILHKLLIRCELIMPEERNKEKIVKDAYFEQLVNFFRYAACLIAVPNKSSARTPLHELVLLAFNYFDYKLVHKCIEAAYQADPQNFLKALSIRDNEWDFTPSEWASYLSEDMRLKNKEKIAQELEIIAKVLDPDLQKRKAEFIKI